MGRGPAHKVNQPPSGNANIGPRAITARERPALRAAPAGSEVANTCVDRFNAAKHSPQISRSPNNAANPDNIELPKAHTVAAPAAIMQVRRSPLRA